MDKQPARMRGSDVEEAFAEQLSLLRFPPAELTLQDPGSSPLHRHPVERIVTVRWNGREQVYACTHSARNTPKAVQGTALEARHRAHLHGLGPLIIVPYLSEKRLGELQVLEVSGLDLCGNGILLGPHFSIWRSGQPNRFPESQPIRNVFRGTSAIFARCFLQCREFPTLTSLQQHARERVLSTGQKPDRTGTLTVGTASKVVQSLEQQMIVARQGTCITLVDGEALLQGLLENHRPSVGPRMEGRTPLPVEAIWSRLRDPDTLVRLRSVTTGLGSAAHHGATTSLGGTSLHVSDLAAAAELLELKETRVFPNLELIQETADGVYFDARSENGVLWASPLQSWLELAFAGPRDREAAHVLKKALLGGASQVSP